LITGGRIDHAHHDTKAHLALVETVEFAKAVQAATDLTDEEDTLIVVTADHSHTMSISGYPARGNNILREYEGNSQRPR
jgi:alkaline phosphatase